MLHSQLDYVGPNAQEETLESLEDRVVRSIIEIRPRRPKASNVYLLIEKAERKTKRISGSRRCRLRNDPITTMPHGTRSPLTRRRTAVSISKFGTKKKIPRTPKAAGVRTNYTNCQGGLM